MLNFSGRHYPRHIILQCVRWYVSYGISYRNLEEMMIEHGFEIDHSTLNRWVTKYARQIEKASRKYKRPVCDSWRMDKTYIKVKGKWCYLYRAADKSGLTVDFILRARRDKQAPYGFFNKALKQRPLPRIINIDKSGSNISALKAVNQDTKVPALRSTVRQVKYLNNIVEQDHRHIKRVTNPMSGFKNFHSASSTIAGIELMNMIKKKQFRIPGKDNLTRAEIFDLIAA
jgi:putative transposase